LQEQRALANAWFPADERDRSVNKAATEDSVELGYAGGHRLKVVDGDIADQPWGLPGE